MTSKKTNNINEKYIVNAGLVSLCLFAFAILIIYNLIKVQILDIKSLATAAEAQAVIKKVIKPERGLIYDRNNNILATNLIKWDIGARYIDLNDPEKVFASLSKVFGNTSTYYKNIFKDRKKYYKIKDNISIDTVDKLKEYDLTGIKYGREIVRHYPFQEIVGQVLGFTNWKNEGKSGIENIFNKYLSGKEGLQIVKKDVKGNTVSSYTLKNKEKKDGGDLFLTIDIDYQTILENELKKAYDLNGPVNARGMIANPNTGEILAMASYPNFNPNNITSSIPSQRRNRVISDQFEPGSIFKVIPIAASLESHKLTPSSMVNCEKGEWNIFDRTLHDTHENEWLSLKQIITLSSNIGAAKIAKLEGNKSIYKTIKKFGFGDPCNICLNAEVAGYLKPVSQWKEITYSQIAMGHNVTTSLLQMVMAYCAVANGGLLLRPYIVKSAYTPENELGYSRDVTVVRRAISKNTSKELRDILENVIIEGTGTNAYIPGYKIAGKTGTAQKVIEGKYSKTEYMSSFIGFFPSNKPILVCGITLDSPTYGRHWGGTSAAPAVKNVFTRIINTTDFEDLYDWIRPNNQTELSEDKKTDSETNTSFYTSIEKRKKKNIHQKSVNKKNIKSIVEQRESNNNKVKVVMPDLIGCSYSQAKYILTKFNLQVRANSITGKIIEQTPQPGDKIYTNSVCHLTTNGDN
ncbi:MAG: penicillin-binding transpeptidase domain-containing protein [Candidatus Marinimicrobia bacterium]|nr:penicillin-binding transpeptidase domain-containing protein [Candidatus Neomarinimicrobiota bacterium]